MSWALAGSGWRCKGERQGREELFLFLVDRYNPQVSLYHCISHWMRWNYTCYLLNWTDWSCLYSPVHSLSELNLNQICTQSKPIKSPLSLHSRGLLLFGFYDLTDQGLVFLFIQSTTIELLVTYIHIRPFKPFSGTFQAKLSRVQVIIKYEALSVVYEGEWGPRHHSHVTASSGHSLLTSHMTLTHSSRSLLSPCHVSWTLYSIAMSGVNVTQTKLTKSSIYQYFLFVSHQYFYAATGHQPPKLIAERVMRN